MKLWEKIAECFKWVVNFYYYGTAETDYQKIHNFWNKQQQVESLEGSYEGRTVYRLAYKSLKTEGIAGRGSLVSLRE